MGQPVSDAAFELIGACVHSLRFALGAPVGYPDAVARFAEDNPPPALFRRVQAVSPPPTREGKPWWTGMTLDGKPFQPNVWNDRLAEVRHEDGIPSLDAADSDKVVLNQGVTMPRRRETMYFPGPDRGRYLCSIFYWTGIPPNAEQGDAVVEYYDEYRMDWDRTPEDGWVAVSLDGFWPPERDSGDVIIPLGACDELCPSAG
jgi:hypothetical protein